MAGFGISETQARSELPSRLSFQLLSLSLFLSLCLFRLKQFHHIQKGEAGQEVFQGLGSFQPFDKRGCANAAP